jgi:hypothetical protein
MRFILEMTLEEIGEKPNYEGASLSKVLEVIN